MNITSQKRQRLLLFPIGFAVLWWGIQSLLLHGLASQSTGRAGVWKRVMTGHVNVQVLFTGSSRTYVHFHPGIIRSNTGMSCFNVGMDGTLPDLQLAFLKTFLAHNRAPKYLLQGVDINMLRRSTGVYNPGQYLAFLHERPLASALARVDSSFSLYRWLPLAGVLKTGSGPAALRGVVGWAHAEDHMDGYQPQPFTWRNDFEQFKKEHPNGIAMPIEPAGVEALRGILQLSRERGIRVALVYSPEYWQSQKLTTNRDQVMDVFRQLAREYQVPFWDYSDHWLGRDTNYFYNSQHLNTEGVQHFCKDISSRLTAWIQWASAQPASNGVTGAQ